MYIRRTMAAALSAALVTAAAVPSDATPRPEAAGQASFVAQATASAAQAAAPLPGGGGVGRLTPPAPKQGAAGHDPHAVLVRFKPGSSAAARNRAAGRVRGTVSAAAPTAGFVKITTAGSAADALAALRADAAVAEVSLDHRRTAARVPNDTYYAGYQQYLSTVRLPQAWDLSTSATAATIAVVDTGVDTGHPDLAGRTVAGYNSVADNADVTDRNGHGTMVAGIAAANTGNGVGVAGAAYTGRIMPIMVFRDEYAYDSDIAEGVTWAVDHGAKIVNMSLGGAGGNPMLHAAIQYAISKNVLVVVSAGNTGDGTPQYPAAYPEVLTVGATDSAANLTRFSSWGEHVDLAAPGFGIISTHSRTTPLGTSFTYAIGDGTSFSAPLVAGVAALARSKFPAETVAQLTARLKSTARDAGPRGVDPYYGNGVLDAYAALGGAATSHFPLREAGAGEPNDVPGRAVPVTGPITANIGIEGDVDWYRYEAPSAATVTVRVVPPLAQASEAPAMDPVLALYDAQLRLIREVDDPDTWEAAEQITAQLGTGTYYLRVRNLNGSAVQRAYTLSVGSAASPPFQDAVFRPTGSSPGETVAIGDVTGDGRADVVLTTGFYFDPANDYKVFVYAQQPDGRLADPVRYDRAQTGPAPVVIVDVDRDGRLDVAVAGGSGIEVLAQNASGRLEPAALIAGSPYGRQLAAGDLDADGDVDFAVNRYPGIVAMLRQPDGSYTSTVVSDTSRSSDALKIGDLDGDGRGEIVSGEAYAVRIHDLTATGWVTSTASTGLTGQDLAGLAIADVTGDGRPEIVAAAQSEAGLAVLGVGPAATVVSTRKYATAGYGGPVDTGDWNGDGRADVFVLGAYSAATILPQLADGTLGAPVTASSIVGQHPKSLGAAVGDINGDGKPDLVGAVDHGMATALHADAPVVGTGPQQWVRTVSVPAYAGIGTASKLTVTMQRALNPATVNGQTVRLLDGVTGRVLSVPVTYDAATRTITLDLLHSAQRPNQQRSTRPLRLPANWSYRLVIGGVTDTQGGVHGGYAVWYVG